MTIIELIIILILILLCLLIYIGALIHCRGQASAGSSEVPVNGVIHVNVSAITCRSFTVQFETTEPVTHVSGLIHLTSEIDQTIEASYTSAQTFHELTFSNGGYGLEKDSWYSYSIMGRDSFDHPADADIEVPFVCKTAKCCADKILPIIFKIVKRYDYYRKRV